MLRSLSYRSLVCIVVVVVVVVVCRLSFFVVCLFSQSCPREASCLKGVCTYSELKYDSRVSLFSSFTICISNLVTTNNPAKDLFTLLWDDGQLWFSAQIEQTDDIARKQLYYPMHIMQLERSEKYKTFKLKIPQPDSELRHSPDFKTVFEIMIGPFSFCEIGKMWGTNKKVNKQTNKNWNFQFPQPDYQPRHSPNFRTVFGIVIGPFSSCEIGKTWGT